MRKLKKIDVNFISLVDKGANRKKLIFKRGFEGECAFEKTVQIKKITDEQKMVFCIVYSPDETDTQGDYAPADVIKEAAYNFMRCARTNNVDKQHDFIPDEGFVAESWIVKENDSVFPGEPSGSWAVGIKVENDETWDLIKREEITGLSLAGLAVIEEIEKQNDTLLERIREIFHFKNGAIPDEIQNIFLVPGGKDETETVLNKAEDKIASLLQRVTRLEEENKILCGRINNFDNLVPDSRQIKKEIPAPEEKIKIWT